MAFLAHFVLILALIITKDPVFLTAPLEPMEIIARVFPLVCLVRIVLRHVKMEDLAIARQVNVIALAQVLLVSLAPVQLLHVHPSMVHSVQVKVHATVVSVIVPANIGVQLVTANDV